MKTVLILAYDFPPYISVGGLRPASWFEHLHAFGIRPVVVTRQWSNVHGNALDYVAPGHSAEVEREEFAHGTLIKAPYKPNLSNRLLLKHGEHKHRLVRKGTTAFHEFGQYLFPVGSKRSLLQAADQFLAHEKVDCIVATGDPFVLFHYANKLSRKYNIPWIADYRDPWSQDFKTKLNASFQKWSEKQEVKVIPAAAAVTTVSSYLKRLIPVQLQQPHHVLPNGYDDSAVEAARPLAQQNDMLTIGFTGTLYPWNPTEAFLREAERFCAERNTSLRLCFYGINEEEKVRSWVEELPHLKGNAVFEPRMPYEDLLKALATCNYLLLFNHYHLIGTKIFDYLGLQRRILFCYTNDAHAADLKEAHYHYPHEETDPGTEQADLISAMHGGELIADAAELHQVLAKAQEELSKHGTLAFNGKDTSVLSRKHRASELAEIIRSVVQENSAK